MMHMERRDEVEGKKVIESSMIMAQAMTPQDVNNAGNVHGGVIMKLMDSIAGAVGVRHSRINVVTASVDRLDFHNPVFKGDLVTLKASLNLVGKSSMEVGVYVQSENLFTGEIRHTASAYFTLVALDSNGKPVGVPPLILETEEEIRRNSQALARRDVRLRARKKHQI